MGVRLNSPLRVARRSMTTRPMGAAEPRKCIGTDQGSRWFLLRLGVHRPATQHGGNVTEQGHYRHFIAVCS